MSREIATRTRNRITAALAEAERICAEDKAEVLEANGRVVKSATRTFPAPSVIRMIYLIHRPRPRVKLSRREVEELRGMTSQENSAPPAPKEEQRISIDEFMKVELRVAKVLEAEAVPKSKKLLKLRIDVGTEQSTIVARIADTDLPDGGAVLGAVVTSSPTVRTRQSVAGSWAWLGLGGLLAVAATRAALGYPGLERRPIDPDAAPDYDDDGLLASVIERGPVYRATPTA